MITINIIIFSFFIILSSIIVFQFVVPSNNLKKKFNLYKIRDELAFLAMNSQVNENHEEYKFLVKNINVAINLYDADFSITNFFKFLIEPQLSNANAINRILKKVDNNVHLRPIFHEYFSIVKGIIKSDISTFKHLVSFLIQFFVVYKKIKITANLAMKHFQLSEYEKNILEPAIHQTA